MLRDHHTVTSKGQKGHHRQARQPQTLAGDHPRHKPASQSSSPIFEDQSPLPERSLFGVCMLTTSIISFVQPTVVF